MRLTREELEVFEGRLELWDAQVETAWVVREPTSPVHERPGQALSALAERIAAVRGSPITCYGAMDLLQRDADGRPRRIMQSDQSLYLRPKQAVLPGLRAMVVGEHDVPDVVLEVDHTTDVRRGKLLQYEAWRFPELWVEVPDWAAPSRPRGLAPALTIHVLGEGGYEAAPESRAFPGWTAAEIHRSMNETTPSALTCAVLERVGMRMGADEGTGPDDDPLLRSQRRKGYNIGHAQGYAQGRVALVCGILQSRAIGLSADFVDTLQGTPAFARSSDAAIAAAALASESEADFLRRIRQSGDSEQ